jgi:hypothetical protein
MYASSDLAEFGLAAEPGYNGSYELLLFYTHSVPKTQV